MKKDNKQRLFEMMGKVDPSFKPKLNEGDAFNDAGEPNMTHSQFRDYSEPSEPEYDDRNEPEYDEGYNFKNIVKELENTFNTIIESGNGWASFFTQGYPNISIEEVGGSLNIYATYYENKQSRDEELYNQNFDNVDITEIIRVIEPYKNIIKTGQDAAKAMDYSMEQNAADSAYASQERAAMGGG